MAEASGTITVRLQLAALEHGRPAPKLRVYLFDAAGRLVQSHPAAERVQFKADLSQRHRITLGPDLLIGEKPPAALAQRLLAAQAISQDYLPARKNPEITISASQAIIISWLLHCVNVHGSVRKLLNPGGDNPQYAPICTGVVQVFSINLACTLDNLSAGQLSNLKNTILSRMLGREIADIITANFGDFATISGLAAGLIPLSGAALKSYIVAHKAALAPFMCNIIPEYDVCYQQYPDVPIQSDGTFSTELCFFIWEPVDLYYEVVQTVDGVEREIADPDIMCTTTWNYNGSQPVLITVTDPTAIACQPDPNTGPGYLYVWPTAIGNVDLGGIDGLENLAGTGLLAGPNGPIPWGGTLPLQMQFHPDLRANNIMYYRWSYRFAGDVAFTQISAPVTHRWQEITIGGGGVIVIHLHGYALGPRLVGGQSNLFEVPDPTLDWIDIDDPADRPFAYFDSTAGQLPGRSGLCTLKLEMFDAAGNHVSCGNGAHAGPFRYLLPDLGAPPGTYTDAPVPNIDANGDLIFIVGVDNNATTAALYDVKTGSHGTGDDCGMNHYSGPNDPVTIDYAAKHPHNYLDWSMSVSRGTHGVVASLGGHTSSADPAQFTNTASLLLGNCPQAAFAVNLYCAARATNGYGRQSQYDSSATIAFALLM
jgi:hypothetical protein